MNGFFGIVGEVLGLKQVSSTRNSSSDASKIVGSGVGITQERPLQGSFDALEADGSVDIEMRRGEICTVEVRGDDNLVDLVETSVSAMRLYIDLKPNTNLSTKIGLKVVVTAPEIEDVDLKGAGDLSMSGLKQSSLRLQLSGAGDVALDGSVDALVLEIAGAGDINAKNLRSRDVSVRVSGAGDVEVHATERAMIRVSGVGDVVVRGNPKIQDTKTSGVGDIDFK